MPIKKTSPVAKQKVESKAFASKTAVSRKEKSTNGKGKHELSAQSASGRRAVENGPIGQGAIEKRAWEIWQNEGCPTGRELEHWLQAERELSSHA